jgi:hypothetical protein
VCTAQIQWGLTNPAQTRLGSEAYPSRTSKLYGAEWLDENVACPLSPLFECEFWICLICTYSVGVVVSFLALNVQRTCIPRLYSGIL